MAIEEKLNIDVEALVENIDAVEYISQFLEEEKTVRDEVWFHCPFHVDETASFSVNKNSGLWFCLSCKRGGNVYNFAKEYLKLEPSEVISELCKYANIEEKDILAPPDTIKFLRSIKRSFHKKENNFNRKILNKDCMLIYEKSPIKEWLAEGISQEILDKYDVRYDMLDNAICFPIYDNLGNIINIKKRTLDPDYKQKNKPKYINMCKIYKLDYLFGFFQNSPEYDKYEDIIVFEGEKSVMKMESFGIFNAVSLSTSSITKEQANTLIKTGKKIVLCMDEGVSMRDIKDRFSYLIKYTDTYTVFDNEGLLDKKMSPIDNGLGVFKKLYDERIKLT